MVDNNSNNTREPVFVPSQTPTSATDYVNIGLSDNGALLLQLISAMPEHLYENHRTVISANFVEHLIDVLCEVAEYYPKKPRKKPAKKATTKRVAKKATS